MKKWVRPVCLYRFVSLPYKKCWLPGLHKAFKVAEGNFLVKDHR